MLGTTELVNVEYWVLGLDDIGGFNVQGTAGFMVTGYS